MMEDGRWGMTDGDGGWRMEMEDGGWRMDDGGWKIKDGGWMVRVGVSSRERLILRLSLKLYKCQKEAKEGCRCYSEKFTIFQAIFDLYSWK